MKLKSGKDKKDKDDWWQCPLRPTLDDPSMFNQMGRLYALREKGFLPYPGSYLEQPNVYVDGMAVLDATLAEIESLQDERRKLTQGGK